MSKNVASTRVVQIIDKASDLQTHMRVVEVEGIKVVEFRDYIPSTKTYRRGYWIPLNQQDVFSVMNGLTEIANSELV